MSPDAWRRSLSRLLAEDGEDVKIRRYTGSPGPNRPSTDTTARARVVGFKPDPLIDTVVAGDRKVILKVEDLENAGFALPVVAGVDKIVIRGRELAIKDVDDNTRRVNGVLIGYELRVG